MGSLASKGSMMRQRTEPASLHWVNPMFAASRSKRSSDCSTHELHRRVFFAVGHRQRDLSRFVHGYREGTYQLTWSEGPNVVRARRSWMTDPYPTRISRRPLSRVCRGDDPSGSRGARACDLCL